MAQYPTVAPPAIVINTAYPGASAKVLEDSVLAVIEQELNGAPGLIYMESSADATGSGTITATFEPGTDVSIAQIEVQNRLSRATPRLPASVTQQGVRVDKSRANFLLFVMLTSKNPAYDPVALGDYAARNIVPELLRVPGVGQAQLFGTERAMRVWIDPAKLVGVRPVHAPKSTPPSAHRTCRSPPAASVACPAPRTAPCTPPSPSTASSATVAQFGNILLRANTDGSSVRLKDVARLELGGQSLRQLLAPERRATPPALACAAGAQRQRAGHGHRHQGPHGRAAEVHARGRELRRALRQLEVRQASRSRRWSRPWSKPWRWCSW